MKFATLYALHYLPGDLFLESEGGQLVFEYLTKNKGYSIGKTLVRFPGRRAIFKVNHET